MSRRDLAPKKPTAKQVVQAKLEDASILVLGLVLIPLAPLVWLAIAWLRANDILTKWSTRRRERRTRRQAAKGE
jgi:hypothetical protein